jgi:hypothetical protein
MPTVFTLISEVTTKGLKIISNIKFRKINRALSLGEVKWRYTVKTCTAFLKTVGDDYRITEYNLNHNHESLCDRT